MKYAIIENDSLSLRRLKSACEKLRPEWTLAFTAQSIEESVMRLEMEADIGLLITDIELDDGNVFNVFKRVCVSCPVIFVTAYDEYTLDAFRQYSIDYILKPLEVAKLERAFIKLEGIERKSRLMAMEMMEQLEKAIAGKKYVQRILISVGDRFESMKVADIVLFYNEEKHIYAYTRSGELKITSFKSLNDIEELLDPDVYFRASRDTIITVDSIQKVVRSFKGKLKITISCPYYKQEIYVSAARRNDFLSWFGHIDQ